MAYAIALSIEDSDTVELQDSLIGKMVFLAILNNQVDVASIILSQSDISVDPIAALSPKERDFSKVVAREFSYAYSASLKALENNRELENRFWVVQKLKKMALKTNMTINATMPMYVRFERFSTLNFDEFADEMLKAPASVQTSMIWNPLGYGILSQLEATNFDKYLTRIFDFNAKLRLFNHIHHKQLDPAVAVNPYFKNELSEIYLNNIFFRSFYEETAVRCLKTSINGDQLASVD